MSRNIEQETVTRGRERIIVRGRRLPKKSYPLTRVSSSFIRSVEYRYRRGTGVGTFTIWMMKGNGYDYFDLPFDVFEGFYYAHSKGTYYNRYIKGQFTSSKIA